jgi:predicted transposase YbfD/YdcC
MSDSNLFSAHISIVPDPRLDRQKRHELLDIIAITICAVFCGADTWVDVEDFGQAREDWLRTFPKLENGIPSHDTFGRVFAALDTAALQEAFASWTQRVAGLVSGVIAIDGKTVRRSHDRASKKAAIHMVSAWGQANGLVLGQTKVDDKSNEITAIPKLLEQLDVRGCIVTIDAMGCHPHIAKKIVERGGDYVRAVKGNQETLHDDIVRHFTDLRKNDCDYHETVEKNHGRIETRQCWVSCDIGGIGNPGQWHGLHAVAMVRSTRQIGQEVSTETRYFITSAKHGAAKRLAEYVRAHRSIENNLHWVLDIAFNEDQSRVRIGNAAQNFTLIRHLCLNILKNDKTNKRGIKGKRKRAGWDNQYLNHLLQSAYPGDF